MSNGGDLVRNRKKASKIIGKHYLEKVLAYRFRKIVKPYKTNGKPLFENSEIVFKIPYKTNGTLALFETKCEKGLQNHYKLLILVSETFEGELLKMQL